MKVTCEKCGKEVDSRGLSNHMKHCNGENSTTENDEIKLLSDFILENFSQILLTDESTVDLAIRLLTLLKNGAIPQSLCPPEIKHLRNNSFRYYLLGARNVDGWLLVEDVRHNK